ncbi:cobalamin biosynthesis protein [Shewanella sp. TC10]|uniref:cobalamin biosynthesis protein n=1 Tax=Shewanella sp. TC10 TaxID=1419739 RepID=UPI00129EF84A|nr:cobalamin biosynthesis protein [Shewanella sp. TC10]
MTIAIHAITISGKSLAQRLSNEPGFAKTFLLHGASNEPANKQGFAAHFTEQFSQFDCHICICSIGIMTRILSSLVQDKRTDAAVICIDEQGQFIVPILSGHRGGANQIALRIAEILGAQAVLTTASDAAKTIAVDLLGAPFGWQLDPSCEADITAVSAAVVNQQPLAIEQHSGHQRWFSAHKSWPAQWHEQATSETQARIVISHHAELSAFNGPTVIWRPKVLHIGVGCDRNTPKHVLEQGLQAFCQQAKISPLSICSVNSIALKADEQGIIALSDQLGVKFNSYHADELSQVEGVENPSPTVMRCVGVPSVAEAACLFAASATQLLAPKFKFKADGYNCTFSASLDKAQAAPKSLTQARAKTAKPMRGFYYHLILCTGRHCQEIDGKAWASQLRRLAGTELSIEKKLKITRSNCIGGCRAGMRAMLYCRTNQTDINHGVSLQGLENLSFGQWRTLFTALESEQPIIDSLPTKFIGTDNPAAQYGSHA